jgi:hypothetical protein
LSWDGSGPVSVFPYRQGYADDTGPDDDNWDIGQGWRIPGWGPPLKDHKFDIGGTEGILQDWYDLPSFLEIPEKFAIVSPAGLKNLAISS